VKNVDPQNHLPCRREGTPVATSSLTLSVVNTEDVMAAYDPWMIEKLEALKGLRDELRLELHLAGMDAKDEWKKLRPLFRDAEKAVSGLAHRLRTYRAQLEGRMGPRS
jgi:hypothetical protein